MMQSEDENEGIHEEKTKKMKISLTFLRKFGMMGAYLKGNEGVQ